MEMIEIVYNKLIADNKNDISIGRNDRVKIIVMIGNPKNITIIIRSNDRKKTKNATFWISPFFNGKISSNLKAFPLKTPERLVIE
ncbi:MAG: hypothetical protein EU549_04085 [Promethearchaeota archaeon]|nr:MAG: hypothetical protein EU549_04085 [Candidatus Lokiarchaeota archaeon]